jgi:ketosteroid isomerase-like protein
MLLSLAFPAAGQDRQAEVREATSKFLTAFNNLDWEGFRRCWESTASMFGATVMFPPLRGITTASSARRVSGSEAEAVWRQVFSAVRERSGRIAPPYQNIQPQDLAIDMVGDSAAVATFHLGDDKRISRRTLVWKNTSGGWKIVHLHASAIDVAQ